MNKIRHITPALKKFPVEEEATKLIKRLCNKNTNIKDITGVGRKGT